MTNSLTNYSFLASFTKKAKKVFTDLSEDDREIESRTMPAKLMFHGYSW